MIVIKDMCSGWLSSCFQSYTRTTIDELEVRRMQLGALLLACFAVQVLRLVTGQLLSILGLMTCLAGNKARCTLCDWDLWVLVIMASCGAALDLASLAVNLDILAGFNLDWRMAPCRRVAMTGAIVAPFLEICCVQVALYSYLPRDKYFFVPTNGQSYGHVNALRAAAGARHSSFTTPECPDKSAIESFTDRIRSIVRGEPEEEADPSSATNSFRCQQCQVTISSGSRLGTGQYADCVYCEGCWAAWHSTSSTT